MTTHDREEARTHIPLALTVNDHLQKNGDSLGLWDNTMDFDSDRVPFYGLYWKGMRHLAQLLLLLDGRALLPLFSASLSGNGDPTSPYFRHLRLLGPALSSFVDGSIDPRLAIDGPLLVDRRRFFFSNGLLEELTVHNHGPFQLRVPLAMMLEADFVDIMDIRGIRTPLPKHDVRVAYSDPSGPLTFSCTGQDGIERETTVRVGNLSMKWGEGGLSGTLTLPPKQSLTIRIQIQCREKPGKMIKDNPSRSRNNIRPISSLLKEDLRKQKKFREMWPLISSSGAPLSRWSENAINDLRILLTPTRYGPFPYAGIPWFSTPFGRDSLIAGFSTLWAFPTLTKSVLLFLAATQAKEEDPFRDAEKGKILHEFRYGEAGSDPMVPFGRYYGSIDATPLFIALSWEYLRRTRDFRTIFRLRKPLFNAMMWIEQKIDPSTGFLSYSADQGKGLVQKGWKDSGDSVFHATGELAAGPIALSEVQGYLFMAYHGYSKLLKIYGDQTTAERFEKKAHDLKERFNKHFWSEKIRMFALALDGRGNRCEVRTSNAGHLLFSGIAHDKYAKITARETLKSDMFSGWGIRTLGSREIRYNPVSYHNGSVWPHDNAIILAGFSRYNLERELSILADAYFRTLSYLPFQRPPELYCGFDKGPSSEGPLSYPTSCRIQAWSVASVFLAIQAVASMDFDTSTRFDINHYAQRIPALGSLRIENLVPMLDENR